MRVRGHLIVAVGLAALVLSGCHKGSDSEADRDPAGQAGRTGYVGIGIYAPSVAWQRLVDAKAPAPANDATARKVDDQALIVVQNSRTGDIRVCGDMTGYCVGLNPWAKRPGQLAPVNLTDHQPAEAEQADEAEAEKQSARLDNHHER